MHKETPFYPLHNETTHIPLASADYESFTSHKSIFRLYPSQTQIILGDLHHLYQLLFLNTLHLQHIRYQLIVYTLIDILSIFLFEQPPKKEPHQRFFIKHIIIPFQFFSYLSQTVLLYPYLADFTEYPSHQRSGIEYLPTKCHRKV